jgi:adenylate cyclase
MVEPDNTFTRRVCAVLLADVTGFSALTGEDDERAARAVQDLQSLVTGIVSDAKGRAEASAGDSIIATFDSVVAAVEAALQMQRQIATREFAGTRLQLRIGVHVGDVLLREGATVGSAIGDAINVAARLQTLARPGTICISESVYRQVRNRFDERIVDLGRQQLKNISDPIHAYLVVPPDFEVQRTALRRRPPLAWAVGLGAVLAVLVVAAVWMLRSHHAAPAKKSNLVRDAVIGTTGTPGLPRADAPADAQAPEAGEQVALGVMVFKNIGGDAQNDWRREVLRDGLNTQLSQLSRVKVYSKEFIDFLISRKGLTEIEAASQLGIKKMLSGSFVTVGGSVRIETLIVDVSTGVLESSYTTTGSEKDFPDLQNKLTMGVIARLNLPVTAEEKRLMLAQKDTDVDAMKMLLEAEGGAPVPPEHPAAQPDAPQSALPQWFATRHGIIPAAFADDTETAIKDVIERLRRATESREVQSLAALYTEFPPELQAAQQKYFENVRDLRVVIDHVDVAVVGDEAVASYTRTDDFVDARTGRPMHVAVRLTKTLKRQDGAWKLAGSK